MKKLLAALTILFYSGLAHSQSTFNPGIRFNPMLCWFKTEAKDPAVSTSKSKGLSFGFSYGLMGDYFIKPNYGIAFELRMCQFVAAYNITGNNFGVPYEYDYKRYIQYVELPVSLKMKTNEIDGMFYYVQAGLVPAVNIRSRADKTVLYNGVQAQKFDNIRDKTSPVDLSMLLGGGLEYNLSGTTNLLGGFSYHQGFIDISKDNNISVKNRYISIDLGIKF